MPADPGKNLGKKKLPTKKDDIAHVASGLKRFERINTLAIRPEYRISLRLGEIEELFPDAPNTREGKMARLQILGLYYFPLGHARSLDYTALEGIAAVPAPAAVPPAQPPTLGEPAKRGAWDHFVNKILGGKDGDAAIQERLRTWVVDGGALPPPAEDSENPDEANFAKIRIPGCYTFVDSNQVGVNNDATYPMPFPANFYDVESTFYTDNPILRKIPLVAKVEKRNPATAGWEPVKDAWVYFQLAKPYSLPDFDWKRPVNEQLNRPPLRPSTVGGVAGDAAAVAKNNGAGPKLLVDTEEARNPSGLPDDDPQRHNCPQDRGGESGKGNAADGTNVAGVIFETTSYPGFNTVGARTKHKAYPVAQQANVAGARHQHSVRAQTNEDGEAGVVFMPSRCGGDRYRFRVYLGQSGSFASDGTGPMAVRAETGTLVIWRSIRVSRYIRQPCNDPNATLLAEARTQTAAYNPPNKVTNNDEYLMQAYAVKPAEKIGFFKWLGRWLTGKAMPAPVRVGLSETDMEAKSKPQGTFCELNKEFDRFIAQFARAFCEVELDPGAKENLTAADWQGARNQALAQAHGAAGTLGLNLNLRRLLHMEAGSAIAVGDAVCHLPMRTPQSYSNLFPANDPQRFNTHGGDVTNQRRRIAGWWQDGAGWHPGLSDYLLAGFIRALCHNGFLPGLTIVQGAYGLTWQLIGLMPNFSGLAQHFRGAYVWAGAGAYPEKVVVPPVGWPEGAWQSYDYTSNSCHEMGHCLFRPHAPGKNPGRNQGGVSNAAQYGWHDGLANCICVMSYKACEGQFCGKCLLTFRGWKV